MIKQISEKISYIEATEEPLSADIGIIKGARDMWLYDVGSDPRSIAPLTGTYHAVLSHFHADHIGNLERVDLDKLYVSKFTFSHTRRGIVVEDDLYVDGLHIFPLPCSHTKGALGLEVEETYAFIGDAIYSRSNAEYYIYNAQLLKAEIEVLKGLRASQLLVSHRAGLVAPREEIIESLAKIYAERDKASPEIFVKKQ